MFSLKYKLPNLINKFATLNLKRNLMSANTSGKSKIAICQITCNSDKENNLNTCKKLITDAKLNGAKMVFLPESFDYIETSSATTLEKCETLDGYIINEYRKIASDNKIWLSLGGFHRKVIDHDSNVKMYNSHIVIDDLGELRQIYDKVHLFEVYLSKENTVLKESDYVAHGKQFNFPISTPVGSLATLICYDVRFPQQSTILRQLGAQILTYPSVFTQITGKAHWHLLMRARAIENQCYVISAAQVGKHNEKRSSYGHALVVDPWGKVIVDCEEESPVMKIVEIDLDYLKEVRTSMPVVNSFRDDLYLQLPVSKKPLSQETYQFGHIQIPKTNVFYETEYSYSCVNIKPVVPGHTMVIPKIHRARVCDLTQAESADLFLTARLIAQKLEKHLNCTSVNFSIQDGLEAGQSVQHVHLHILPRKKGDFKRSDDIYDRLLKHDKDLTTGLRTLEEMSQEANEFRKLFNY